MSNWRIVPRSRLGAAFVWVGFVFVGCQMFGFAETMFVRAEEPSDGSFAAELRGEEGQASLWQTDNLVAWCIVPFDASRRGPSERAEMLNQLGIRRLAYDYRGEHIPTFDEEVETLKKHGIELTAWWFPTTLNAEARGILEVLRRHQVKTQLWVTGGGAPTSTPEEQEQRIVAEAERIGEIARAAAEIDCSVALYNHGGWFGEPANQVAIIEHLKMPNVGIVYNLHHAHHEIDRLPELLRLMRPYLLALNLNGTTANGDTRGKKILPLAAGEFDLAILQTIEQSGYRGPIGILNHTDLDAHARLEDNLRGLHFLVESMENRDRKLAPPKYETWDEGVAEQLTGEALGTTTLAAASLADQASRLGDAEEGLAVFASQKFACISCHRLGEIGGQVGPALDRIGTERSGWEIVESILEPQRRIEPAYTTTRVLSVDGQIRVGYLHEDSDTKVVLRDPSSGQLTEISADDVESIHSAGSLMPGGLVEAMRSQQLLDVVAMLTDLGRGRQLSASTIAENLGHFVVSQPAKFERVSRPLDPENWTQLHQPVNRDRLFQYYAKQAMHFRSLAVRPPLLEAFPGLDGGGYGHWGNQNEAGWRDERWNATILPSVQCGVFRGGGLTVPRGICVQLREGDSRLSVCFNPDTLSYDAVWKDGFVGFSAVRHGFMDGLLMEGTLIPGAATEKVTAPHQFLGYYAVGPRVVFAYRIGDVEYLDSPTVIDGQFQRVKAPRAEHPFAAAVDKGADPQWPQVIETAINFGTQTPYAVDTIEIPRENPWKALIFAGDHDFMPNGDALICTMQGDVWRVSGLDSGGAGQPGVARWRRIAAGLFQPLGLVVSDGEIYVMCRDRLVHLVDSNGDGEIDFYRSHSDAHQTSPSGHDFICGLQRDALGNFYTASGNQGLLKISPDGSKAEVIATGFRNPDGLGLDPAGVLTVPCSEGEWTPASMICAVKPSTEVPHYGYRGPRDGQPPTLPLVYLPRGIDNSAGGQAYVASERWGPLSGQMVHTSFGAGTYMLLLRDQVGAQMQGAIAPMPGDFASGVHRARFREQDGQLYVSGMAGWGSYTTDDGCFQRIRYTGDPVQQVIGFHVHSNGVMLRFSSPLDRTIATNRRAHFAQSWNYRYSQAYGSPEYSARHFGVRGHDTLSIRSAHVTEDGHGLFLEIPDLQPVNQLHLLLAVGKQVDRELFMTVHALDEPYEDFVGYRPDRKVIYPHPILADLAMAIDTVPNPFRDPIEGARAIKIRTASNLSFETRTFEVKPGEAIRLTLVNPDVVPHNWALLNPGTERVVGELANQLISDPTGAARHYIPETQDVLAYTDVVEPNQEFTIHFLAPEKPGRYPFMCTFPGHWMVMQGTVVVR